MEHRLDGQKQRTETFVLQIRHAVSQYKKFRNHDNPQLSKLAGVALVAALDRVSIMNKENPFLGEIAQYTLYDSLFNDTETTE